MKDILRLVIINKKSNYVYFGTVGRVSKRYKGRRLGPKKRKYQDDGENLIRMTFIM